MAYRDYEIKAAEALARKVVPVYQLLNWQWSDIKGVPTEKDIVQTLLSCLDSLNKDEKVISSSTGGLEASRYTNEEGHTSYTFSFRMKEHLDYWAYQVMKDKYRRKEEV